MLPASCCFDPIIHSLGISCGGCILNFVVEVHPVLSCAFSDFCLKRHFLLFVGFQEFSGLDFSYVPGKLPSSFPGLCTEIL